MEILRTIPGAAQITQSGTNRSNYSGGIIGINGSTVNGSAGGMSGVSINGQANTGLSINMDGQNVEDPGGPGSATPVNPNPDMLSEVTILTSNYGADNAKGPVVINSMTKSGGSTFHGGVHFYARNSAMNSEDKFNKAQESDPSAGLTQGQLKIPSHYYYPGFTVGGPILIPGTNFNKARNRYFFHESFENYRQLIDGGIDRAFVPTATMINSGDFSATTTWGSNQQAGRHNLSTTPNTSNGFVTSARPGCAITGGVMTSNCISSAAQLWMKASLPLPTTADGTPTALGFNYIAPVQQSQNSTHNMVKVDVNLAENTKAYVSWSRQRESSMMPLGLWAGAGDWIIPAPSQVLGANTSDFYAANVLHIFSPTLTVEARFGYTHMDMPGAPQDPTKVLRNEMKFPIQGVFANENAPVATSWSNNIPNIGDIGHDYHPTFYAEKGIPSTGADLTKVYKTHTAKFGFNWENTYNTQDAWSQYMGVYSFNEWNGGSGNSYADMLMGDNFGYYEQAMPPAIKMSQASMSFYGTDHWKINRRITVDFGVRFDHYGPDTPDGNIGDATFNPAKYQAGVKNSGLSWHGLDSSISIAGQSLATLFYSPRVGAAIDIFENGKTVVRGGWGQFRYMGYVVANQDAANTAMGSAGWSSPGAANTWESVDQFINTGGANGTTSTCAANAVGGIDAGGNHCAPVIKWGGTTDFTNASASVVDATSTDMPYTTTYSLTIDQQLPGKLQLETGYVGNHSYKTRDGININSVPMGVMTTTAVATACAGMDSDMAGMLNDGNCQQKFRPYGGNYQKLTAQESAKEARYDSLQASLIRSVGWATASLNYTFAKNLGDTNSSGAVKDYGVKEYWSVQGINRAHTFNAAYTFAFPKMTYGGAFGHAALNGWELSGITQVMSGAMLTAVNGAQLGLANATSGAVLGYSPDVTVAPVLTCDPKKGLKKGQFANGSCFKEAMTPSDGIGNTRFPYLAGPKFWSSDLSLRKNIKISENQNLEFRAAAFNFMNHALLSFSSGDNNAKVNFDSTGAMTNATSNTTCPGPSCKTFGYPDFHYGNRVVELSAKYSF